MSGIADARAALAAQLTEATDKVAFAYMPGRLNPPCWVVDAGSPYLDSGNTFGSLLVRFDAVYFAKPSAANSLVTAEVDDVFEAAATGLFGGDWEVETVTVVDETANGATYLGGVFTVTKTINL
jgi:hypothetical protein